MNHYAYILKCSDGSLYTGYTNDLDKRVHEHNNTKKGAHYTKIRRPVELLYCETFSTLGEARARESEIKSLPRKQKLDLIKEK